MSRERDRRRPASPPLPRPRKGFVAVGLVLAPRGLSGELTVTPLTDFPQRFQPGATVWAAGAPYTIRSSRPHRNALLVELEGIETESQALALRGALFEIPEEELPPLAEGQYYRFQLLGLDVVDREGQPLGRIEEVLETGANDVYIVRNAEGELLLPAIDAVVKEVDLSARRMVVELMEGLERRPRKRPPRR
ncbi:MAG: 16S rRNA processing protein RimM [Chloroflexi bacterium]|nr:16S rRNA processing protein RimM [Chloroflexota bacterium]